MPSTLHGPRRIVVDHELLGRLRPDSTRQTWIDILRRAGLGELGHESPGLPMLEELGRAVAALPGPQVVTTHPGLPLTLISGLAVMVLSLLIPVVGFVEYSWLMVPWVVALLGFVAAGWVEFARSRVPAPAPSTTRSPASARAFDALRRLRATSFVTAYGSAILENTPHQTWFALRAEVLASAERQIQDRIEEIEATRARIREVNRRLGRPEDDPETEQLGRAIAAEEAGRARVREVAAHLAARRQQYSARLDELRVLAERRVLSETVGRLTEGAAEHASRAAAQVEVDVLETEREIRALDNRIGQEDARLAAVLELVGATR